MFISPYGHAADPAGGTAVPAVIAPGSVFRYYSQQEALGREQDSGDRQGENSPADFPSWKVLPKSSD